MKSAVASLRRSSRIKKVTLAEKPVCGEHDAIIKSKNVKKKEPTKKRAPTTKANSNKADANRKSVTVKKLPIVKKDGVQQDKPYALKKVPTVKKPAISDSSKKLVSKKQPVSKKKKLDEIRKSSVKLVEEVSNTHSINTHSKYTGRKRIASASLSCIKAAPADVDSEKRKVELMWRKTKESLSLAKPSSKRGSEVSIEQSVMQFSQQYEISGQKALGSGQFGIVYTAIHKKSSEEVAVKIISLKSFVKKKSLAVETLKSEIAILQALDHPGIIKVRDVFETSDQIHVVLEKMNGDMLEKILSQPNGRMVEHQAKFLIAQIIHAVQYLHSKGIAHCDLKPENVLLSDFYAAYPQIKLCDFGYAKFIRDAQRLRKIVGTPAYLAPEVLQKRGYNKSVDLWSIGVIIYVTLSGSFPFEEGEDIASQMENLTHFFPSDPWEEVSGNAVELIRNLLKIQITERLSIEGCLAHEWLRDAKVYQELLNLEQTLGIGRYLTSEEDDIRIRLSSKRSGIV